MNIPLMIELKVWSWIFLLLPFLLSFVSEYFVFLHRRKVLTQISEDFKDKNIYTIMNRATAFFLLWDTSSFTVENFLDRGVLPKASNLMAIRALKKRTLSEFPKRREFGVKSLQ